MADQPLYPATGDDTGVRPDRGPAAVYPGTPRWVKVFGIITLVVFLLVVAIIATGVGGHGPGRHVPSGGAGGHTPPSGVTAHRVQQP